MVNQQDTSSWINFVFEEVSTFISFYRFYKCFNILQLILRDIGCLLCFEILRGKLARSRPEWIPSRMPDALTRVSAPAVHFTEDYNNAPSARGKISKNLIFFISFRSFGRGMHLSPHQIPHRVDRYPRHRCCGQFILLCSRAQVKQTHSREAQC